MVIFHSNPIPMCFFLVGGGGHSSCPVTVLWSTAPESLTLGGNFQSFLGPLFSGVTYTLFSVGFLFFCLQYCCGCHPEEESGKVPSPPDEEVPLGLCFRARGLCPSGGGTPWGHRNWLTANPQARETLPTWLLPGVSAHPSSWDPPA